MSKIGYIVAFPCFAIFYGIFFENKVLPFVFGLPFILVWIMGCVILTSLALFVVEWLNPDREEESLGDHS
jgi:hypothetical protein